MPPKRKAAPKVKEVEVAEDVSDEIPKKRGKTQKKEQSEVKGEPERKSTRKKAEKAEPEPPEKEIEKAEPKKKTVKNKVERAAKDKAEVDTEKKSGKIKKDKDEKKKDEEEIQKPKSKKENDSKKPKTIKKSEEFAESKPTLLNTTVSKWEDIDFDCNKQNSKGEIYNLKITSWNVDGLRAWFKKDGLKILTYDKPDIFCLQETKCSVEKLPKEVRNIEGYHDFWCSSDKEGYAGVAVYSKEEPLTVTEGINDETHDTEGRCLTLEFETFYLVNVYVPNAGRGLVTLDKRLEWNEAFKNFIKELDEKKPVILCGDMNVAHNEIDLANPKTNKKNAGFTQEEREGMTDFLADGYVDSFRNLYPEEKDVYTFWSYIAKARAKNVGWRLDYFILSKRIMENVCDNVVRDQVFGSDHCPVTLFINI